MIKERGVRVVFIGGNKDREVMDQIAGLMKEKPIIETGTGKKTAEPAVAPKKQTPDGRDIGH